jgi:hypothetical protein
VKASVLRDALIALIGTEGDLEVEIATQPNHKDEWYEPYDLEVDINHKGDRVVVLNTD